MQVGVHIAKNCYLQLNELAKSKNKKDLQVLAISLDTLKTDWINFILVNKLENLINLSDLHGWNSKTAKEYFIYATPTMFFTDKEKILIGKPNNLQDIFNQIKFKQ